ncbi:hypothetical protein Tco_1014687 [Tanacetum coccineum]
MTLYNALPLKDCKVDLLTQQYEKCSISSEETIESGFTRFNAIIIGLKSLDQDYFSKNHVRMFLRALPLKWRAQENDGVASKTTKEKVKSLNLKAKVTRKQNSNDSDSQRGSSEESKVIALETKAVKAQYKDEVSTIAAKNVTSLVSVENKDFIGGAWSDSEDGNKSQNDATCLMEIDSQEDGWTCTGHRDTSMVMVVHTAGLDPNIVLGLDNNDTIIVGMKDGTNHGIDKTNLKQIIPNMAVANTCLGKFMSMEIIASGWGIKGLLPSNATIIYVITLHEDADLGCPSHVIA